MDSILVFAAALGTLAALLAIYWFAKCHAEDLRTCGTLLDQHYTAAQKLISDPDTPESVVEFAVMFAGRVGTPTIARSFAMHLIRGRLGTPQAASSEKARRFAADLGKLDVKLRQPFADMMVSGMAASACADPLFSRAYRKGLDMFFSRSGQTSDRSISVERANTAALDLSARGFCAA